MPVTKTAKRALRGSSKKQKLNRLVLSKLDIALRRAKTTKTKESIIQAVSLADRASKTRVIHKNKAARIKSFLSTLLLKTSARSKRE